MRHVVYLTDENYAMPTCVSIISLMHNNVSNEEYKVHILINGVSNESLEKMRQLGNEYIDCEIINVCNEEYRTLADTCLSKGIHVSETALFKFDVANILSDIDEVLYLDSDIIINKDLSELFTTDISEYYLAAVDDMGDEFTERGESTLAKRIGIVDRKYFNSGVMYLNLKKMRQDNLAEKLLRYRMEALNYFMDQDALNAVMGENRRELPYCFNYRMPIFDELEFDEVNDRFFSNKYKDMEECLFDQSIIHMTNKRKPWQYDTLWSTKIFLSYYEVSPYQGIPLELKSYVKELNDQLNEIWKNYQNIKREHQRKIWPFPFDKVPKGSKVVLYGAGNVGQDMYRQIVQTGYCELVLWVDKNWKLLEGEVKSPKYITGVEFNLIIVAVANVDIATAIKEQLILDGVERERIIYE